jgi:hypothetical protein
VMFHESYQNPKMRHDLALVRLDRPIIFDSKGQIWCAVGAFVGV